MLAAYHPFDPYGRLGDMALREAVVSLRWDFKDKVWDGMSDDVKDLIRKLLCDADTRLDADGILAHREYSNSSSGSKELVSCS